MNRFVTYREFGAKGDGKTNDLPAIAAAHAFANEKGLPVRAGEGDTYYIGKEREVSAVIMTDTDWTGAAFVVDDSGIPPEERGGNVFNVVNDLPELNLLEKGITTLSEGQKGLVSLGCDCYVAVTDNEKRNYFREGLNQDNGHPQTDCFILRKDGLVDEKTPIIWDFDHISVITARPIPAKTLIIRGGTFTGACSLLEAGISYGAATWAMPDGRNAGEPLGNSIGPRTGADKSGLTAMLNSVSSLPLDKGVGGTTLNVLLPASFLKTEALRKDIGLIMKSYLENGGQMAQITTASREEMLDAKVHPERHGNLIVRIGGFSIRFIELNDKAQDEIIARYA